MICSYIWLLLYAVHVYDLAGSKTVLMSWWYRFIIPLVLGVGQASEQSSCGTSRTRGIIHSLMQSAIRFSERLHPLAGEFSFLAWGLLHLSTVC